MPASGLGRRKLSSQAEMQSQVARHNLSPLVARWQLSLFLSSGSDAAIYRVRISDHKLEKVVSLKGIRLTIGEVGTWCGLAPDDSPLILRDVGSQEIYAPDLKLP